MPLAKRKSHTRREPSFDAGTDLRLSTADRIGASMTSVSRRRRRKRSKGVGAPLRRGLYWCLVLGLWAVIVAGGSIVWVAANLPPIQSLDIPKRPPAIQIVGLDGKLLATRGNRHGATLTLREMPAYLPKAFIAIEDRRFYSHFGIDLIGLARAFTANVIHRSVSQGGSTITQQLAKNLFLTQERTITRKLQEVVLALWLEHRFSKTEILELYLNRVYFGAGAYGVDAASQRYFGKSARQVTLAEAAMLAGLVRSPSRLAPIHNPDGATRRAKLVIAAMRRAGFIGAEAAKLALAHPAHVVKVAGTGSANYVADWIMDVLDDLVGNVEQDLVVQTSIDPALQAAAETALSDVLAKRGAQFQCRAGGGGCHHAHWGRARPRRRQRLCREPV